MVIYYSLRFQIGILDVGRGKYQGVFCAQFAGFVQWKGK